MRTCLLAALAVACAAPGCSTLKPSHRDYKAERASAAFDNQNSIQQVQYAEPAGRYVPQHYLQPAGQPYMPPAGPQYVQPAGFHHGQAMAAQGGYGCPTGNCPGYGGNGGHFGHGAPRGYQKLFDGGRYGHFNGAHGTPGYPHHHFAREYVGPQGPPTAQTAYPYYTIRGPRDFLLDNPPSIGR